VDDVEVSEATNGNVKVYGYQVDASSVSGDVGQIDRKVLTANADVADRTYDGTTTANLSNVALVGVVAGGEGKVDTSGSTGAFSDKNAGQNKSVTGSGIALTGEEAGNYSFDTNAEIGKADIDRKLLTASADVADKTYDGTTTANLSNVSLVGIVGGDEGKVGTSGSTGAFSDKNAGQDKSVTGSGITLTGDEASNYAFDTDAEIGKADIDRKLLTASADVADKTYDGTTTANLSNVSLVGIVSGDEGKVDTSGTTGAFTDKNAGQNKSVTGSGIALTGEEADNYAFDTDAEIGKADIDRKVLTVNADVANKTYDGTTTASLSNVALVGVVAGDEGKVDTSGTTGAFSDKNAGQDKSVTGSGIALTGEEADNYAFDTGAEIGKADIDRKLLTANADVSNKTYDGTTTANLSNVSLVGIVDGDEGKVGTSGSTGSFSDKNAGQDKSVSGSGLALTGEEADNYAFDSDAEIGKADIDRKLLTANADVADKTYDGTTTANLSNVSLVGIVDGDQGKVGTSGSTGAFSDKNAGQNKSVTGSGIALTGEEADNYAFDTDAQVGTADIDRKIVTAKVEVADKLYDGKNTAIIRDITLDGVIQGDAVGAVGEANFETPAAGQGKTVAVIDLQLLGDDAANYQLADQPVVGVASIQPPMLPPVGLINTPEGANGTGTAVKRPDNQPVAFEPASHQPLPSTALFSDTPSLATSPVGVTVADALVLQDAVLSGNGRMSLALADRPSEPAVRKSLHIYRTRAGEPLRGEGQYAATDLGSSITLELADAGTRQAPVLQAAGAKSAQGSVALASGQRLSLQVTLMADGVLLVQVPQEAGSLDSDELAAYGLAVAKKNLGTSVNSIEHVVVEHALRQAAVSTKAGVEVAAR